MKIRGHLRSKFKGGHWEDYEFYPGILKILAYPCMSASGESAPFFAL